MWYGISLAAAAVGGALAGLTCGLPYPAKPADWLAYVPWVFVAAATWAVPAWLILRYTQQRYYRACWLNLVHGGALVAVLADDATLRFARLGSTRWCGLLVAQRKLSPRSAERVSELLAHYVYVCRKLQLPVQFGLGWLIGSLKWLQLPAFAAIGVWAYVYAAGIATPPPLLLMLIGTLMILLLMLGTAALTVLAASAKWALRRALADALEAMITESTTAPPKRGG